MVLSNSSKAQQVWGWLGKLLWREGANPFISEKFYCAVVKVMLLFGADTWFLLAAMLKNSSAYM